MRQSGITAPIGTSTATDEPTQPIHRRAAELVQVMMGTGNQVRLGHTVGASRYDDAADCGQTPLCQDQRREPEVTCQLRSARRHSVAPLGRGVLEFAARGARRLRGQAERQAVRAASRNLKWIVASVGVPTLARAAVGGCPTAGATRAGRSSAVRGSPRGAIAPRRRARSRRTSGTR